MPAPCGGRSGALPPPPRLPQPRNVDDLIRDLQRINLSQCLDQLNTDISQLNQMEHQLGSWTGLYVRCPGPEPDDLGHDPADKKSSSGYSTESASPPDSRDISDEAAGVCVDGACCETEVKRRLSDDEDDAGFVREFGDLAAARPRYHSVRLLGTGGGPLKFSSPRAPAGVEGFRPAAASTPAPAPGSVRTPRSPKTLRFAATAELIAPDSPSRRQVASGAPRPGILRSSGRHGGGGGAAGRQGAPGGAQARRESAERVTRAVSALSRLDAELNGSVGRTYGTGQFVSPRRRASPGPRPPPPLDPLVLVRTATDTEESDTEGADLPPPPPPPADSGEPDPVRWRRSKPAPPPPQLRPPRRKLAWLLSCASRRRRPSPPSAYLSAPPPAAAPSAALFKCNLCKARFPEHVLLVAHVHERHVRVQVRPKYSCGLCPARFYASRFLAKHCSYHHAAAGDRRTQQYVRIRRIV
ncbi:hypothetical protein FJT64_019332 [Amphibalanus amphitrite]|uniref:C2H2-type domain-containing protein n=1 Tax=Amphibalanus amphitrite TaxID=1232801 RepID=A0A6A4X5N4_AMPAM|nr:hypothetical protein FJT64_019332 [Amphibalanus amphitrite]